MNDDTTNAIKTLLAELRAQSLNAFRRQMLTAYSSEDSRENISQHGVRNAVRLADENLRGLEGRMIHEARFMSSSSAAFQMVRDAGMDHLADLEREIERGRGLPLHGHSLAVLDERVSLARTELKQRLQEARTEFVERATLTPVAEGAKRGPKAKYDWLHATNMVWGRIFRGELIPKKQKDIEEAFVAILRGDDGKLEAVNTREYAQPIWQEFQREPQDDN